jgi:hypothetical protein
MIMARCKSISMKETLSQTCSVAREFKNLTMGASKRECGKMVSEMAPLSTLQPMASNLLKSLKMEYLLNKDS